MEVLYVGLGSYSGLGKLLWEAYLAMGIYFSGSFISGLGKLLWAREATLGSYSGNWHFWNWEFYILAWAATLGLGSYSGKLI